MDFQKHVRVNISKCRGIWYMNYTIDNTRMRKSLGTKIKGIAQDIARKHEDEFNNGTCTTAIQNIPISEFWNVYKPYAQAKKRPKTVYGDFRMWSRFADWLERFRFEWIECSIPPCPNVIDVRKSRGMEEKSDGILRGIRL